MDYIEQVGTQVRHNSRLLLIELGQVDWSVVPKNREFSENLK